MHTSVERGLYAVVIGGAAAVMTVLFMTSRVRYVLVVLEVHVSCHLL